MNREMDAMKTNRYFFIDLGGSRRTGLEQDQVVANTQGKGASHSHQLLHDREEEIG